MSFNYLFVALLCILSMPDKLLIFINSENFENDDYVKKADIGTKVEPTQSTLIKLGFSGILWEHVKSNRSQMSNLSPQCLDQLINTSDLIDSDDPQALKLISASSRLPNKMFQISYADLGGYDSCLSIESTHYCQFSVLPKKMNIYPHWFSRKYNNTIHIGFCLPRSCSPNEIDNLITSAIEIYDWEKIYFHGCLAPSTFLSRLAKANASQLGCFILLSGILSIIGISSIMYQLGFFHEVNKVKWLRHFALQQTHHNLISFQVRKRINFIDYLRIFCTSVALPLHAFIIVFAYKLIYVIENLENFKYYVTQWMYQPLNNDWIFGGLVHIGAIIELTHLWPEIESNTSFATYARLFIKKFILYWPVMIVAIAMEIVLPLFGTGPVYSYSTQWRSDICSSNWIYTLLHIHNCQRSLETCYVIFWSFNAEIHFFLLTLILIHLYKTRPRTAYIINWIAIFLGLVITFFIYYSNNFTYRFAGYKPEHWEQLENYMTRTLIATENYLSVHAISFMVTIQYLMNPRPSQGIKESVFWLITVTLSLLTTAIAYSSGISNIWKIEMSPFWNSMHAVTSKLIVSLGWSWLSWCNFHHARVTKLIVQKAENEDNSNERNIIYKFFLVAARTYIWSHWIVFAWFYSRKTQLYSDLSFFSDTVFLTLIGFLSGLPFYYIILGPYESILRALKIRKFGKYD